PAALWSYYIQLVQVEEALRTLKGDLAVRPIHHQEQGRIEAHIFHRLPRLLSARHPRPQPERAALPLDMTTTWTGLLVLAGLSPAGMAASLAAPDHDRSLRRDGLVLRQLRRNAD